MKVNTISIIDIPTKPEERIPTGRTSFDNFMGGGFVDSQCILLAGQPGAGKSTMLLQLSTILVDNGEKILYFSGEESLGQIKLRANRLGTLRSNIICTETLELNAMYKTIEEIDPKFVIVDSMQMLHSNKVTGEQGSERQVRECMLSLTHYIKQTNRILIAIGHANKSKEVAGLMKLQHMVDTIFFIRVKDGNRVIESRKNRFGSTDPEYPLTMTQHGFEEFSVIKEIQAEPEATVGNVFTNFFKKLNKDDHSTIIQKGTVKPNLKYNYEIKYQK